MGSLRTYLEDMYGEEIQAVYRHFALSFHELAMITGEAAEAAGAQGKFWEMHDLLYERQQEWTQLTEETIVPQLVEYAEELELDTEQFEQALEEHTYRERVEADTEDAMEAGLPGTPSYVINGVLFPTDQFGLHPVLIDSFIQMLALAPEQYTEVPPEVIDTTNDYVATIETNKGDVVVELFDDVAPTNVNSFVFLAQDGWYDGLEFFHVEPGFVVQSGDPTNIGVGLPYPGYTCGSEISPEVTFEEPGMLALYAPMPEQNHSQFFITLAPQPDFEGQYTIIGRVTEGMDVLESLTPTEPRSGEAEADVIETIIIEEQ
jgi:cyclophilin family peptidyl-prolyl cis-trans isomerase